MSLYEDLGVAKDATKDTIKRAFRKRAAKTHPDKGGDVASFQIIQRAYDILGDDEKRKRYDEGGSFDNPPDIRTLALQQLAAMVFQIIEASSSVEAEDILASLKRAIQTGMSSGREQQAQIQRRISKFEKALKRFSTKGTENPIAAFIEQKIREQQATFEGTKKHIELGEVMMELIKDYSYKTDKQAKGQTSRTQSIFFPYS